MTATTHPPIPEALDDKLFDALRGVVGSDLAFAAVDAVWLAFCEHATLVTRVAAGGLVEVLEIEANHA